MILTRSGFKRQRCDSPPTLSEAEREHQRPKHEDRVTMRWLTFLYCAMCEIMKLKEAQLPPPAVTKILAAIKDEHLNLEIGSRSAILDEINRVEKVSRYIANIPNNYTCTQDVSNTEIRAYRELALNLRVWIEQNFKGRLQTVLLEGRTQLSQRLDTMELNANEIEIPAQTFHPIEF